MAMRAYTHKRDPDGVCSAAIMKRYMDSNNSEGSIEYIDYSPDSEVRDVIGEIRGLPDDSSIVLMDLRLDGRYSGLMKGALAGKKLKARWLDHHEWEDGVLKELDEYVDFALSESIESCGAEIVQREYMKDDKVSEALAKIARDSDIDAWLNNPPKPSYALTFPLADLITYYNYLAGTDRRRRGELLDGLADRLARASPDELLNRDFERPFWDAGMDEEWKRYDELKNRRLVECLMDSEVLRIGRYRLVIGYSDHLLATSIAANHLLENSDADLSVVVYDDGMLSFRRRNKKIRCDRISKLFGGGGHVYAAGGQLDFNVKSGEDLRKAKKIIVDRVSSVI